MSPHRSQLRLASQAAALVALFSLGMFLGHKAPSQQSLLTAPGRSLSRAAAQSAPDTRLAPQSAAGWIAPVAADVQPADYIRHLHPTYRLLSLGRFGRASDPTAINDTGRVIGAHQTAGGQESFVWHNGRVKHIGGFWASDINDHGEIAGYVDSKTGVERPMLWTRSRMRSLAIPPGALNVYAYGVNNRSEVIENSVGNPAQVSRAFVCAGGHLWPLWTLPGFAGGQANAINDKGLVVGQAQTNGGWQHACLWRGGRMVDLGTLPNGDTSIANAINARGLIVGSASVGPKGSDLEHAVLWRHGHIADLGTLAGWPKSGASAINNRGQVVGKLLRASANSIYAGETHPFLWQRGRMVDLNSLIAANSGWVLTDAVGINNRGEILGTGIFHGRHRAYLLVPMMPRLETTVVAIQPARSFRPAVVSVTKPRLATRNMVAAHPPAQPRKRVIVRVAAYQKIFTRHISHRALQPPPIPIAYQGTIVGRGSMPNTYQVQDGTVSRNVYFGPHAGVRAGEEIQVRGILDRDGTVAAGSVARLGNHSAYKGRSALKRPAPRRQSGDYEIITTPN